VDVLVRRTIAVNGRRGLLQDLRRSLRGIEKNMRVNEVKVAAPLAVTGVGACSTSPRELKSINLALMTGIRFRILCVFSGKL
jgi:hypothetical protein